MVDASTTATAAATPEFKISPSMRIGYVSLNVSDLERSLDFYQGVLGFRTIERPSEGKALLSANGGGGDDGGGSSSRLVELVQAKEKPDIPRNRKRAGLYHFAILLPERKDLADMLLNLSEKRDQVYFDGMSDHLVSEAIYIRDPDFNGVEIYRDRPRSEWKWTDGKIAMATEPLNTEDLLNAASASGWKAMPAKTTIGHVHLHVRNLANALRFYRDQLGLDFTATYPGAYFFSAGGYHHHIAVNTWLGTEIPAASPDKVGLNHFGIELPNLTEFESTLREMGGSKEGFVADPEGIRIRLYSM
ncbi:MAG TPA: VOC family protein [Nitrososphaera sp.]|nr:VOC family protein [Nitrososphaera sp.]